MKYLDAYPAWNEVQALVLGLPLQANQMPSENAERTLAFGRKLAAKRPQIPIYLMDERFTSVMAHQSLLESGASRNIRRDKGVVDQIAAVILFAGFSGNASSPSNRTTSYSCPMILPIVLYGDPVCNVEPKKFLPIFLNLTP